MQNKSTVNQKFLSITALTIVAVGAIGSLVFMFNTARNQNSILLLTLFAVWVVSPFVGLFIFNKIYKRYMANAHMLLYWLMIMLTIASLIAYSGVFIPRNAKAAFIYLVVPFISWILMMIFFLSLKKIKAKGSDNKQLP